MLPPRRSTLGLVPLPEHRRRRIAPLMVVGAVGFLIGAILRIGFVWGLGAGIVITGAIALWIDRNARRRHPGP